MGFSFEIRQINNQSRLFIEEFNNIDENSLVKGIRVYEHFITIFFLKILRFFDLDYIEELELQNKRTSKTETVWFNRSSLSKWKWRVAHALNLDACDLDSTSIETLLEANRASSADIF